MGRLGIHLEIISKPRLTGELTYLHNYAELEESLEGTGTAVQRGPTDRAGAQNVRAEGIKES